MRTALMLVALAGLAGVLAGCQGEEMAAGEGEPAEQYMYTVQGDEAGLWDIAERVYGDGRMWQHVADANPGVDSNKLEKGDKLVMPRVVTDEGETVTPAGCERQKIY